MAGTTKLDEGWETELPAEDGNVREKHEKAIKMQNQVKLWMETPQERNKYMVETGISYPERRLKIYLPPGELGKDIKRELIASGIEGIEQEADFAELKKGNRTRLAMNPGRTPVYFGDGSSATLGTFLRDPVNQKMYALTSQHTQIPMIGRDVFVKLGNIDMYCLGRVVADVKESNPVVDACLIELDVENEEMYRQVNLAMYFNDPTPPIYLKMHENAENLGIEGGNPLRVSKYGYRTRGTSGFITEYSRDIVEAGQLLTDNIVTVSDDPNIPFAAAGDSGSIVFRSVRSPQEGIHFYDAISMLYMADDQTGESFSIPLPRCVRRLTEQINVASLELATENPGFLLNP